MPVAVAPRAINELVPALGTAALSIFGVKIVKHTVGMAVNRRMDTVRPLARPYQPADLEKLVLTLLVVDLGAIPPPGKRCSAPLSSLQQASGASSSSKGSNQSPISSSYKFVASSQMHESYSSSIKSSSAHTSHPASPNQTSSSYKVSPNHPVRSPRLLAEARLKRTHRPGNIF
ncbi:hypothetical protein CC78DRAFT_584990 [Lojkania enalia]|uniref:Uncharacterized protein n=1 Tax=Lojkania enalia TaxID=147567 RepID=A0A9P4K1Q0_9PLEO|nr:hypothetical protein CC78DRAFT_584990 [Didymosphaeria enalia]